MATVSAYERPSTIEDAVRCLGRPGAVPVGGGTKVNAAATAEPVVIVDLQALGLDRIERVEAGRLRIGATVTLHRLVDSTDVPAVIREAARREQPSTLRAVATLAGCVTAAAPDSEVLAALLVHDAQASVAGPDGEQTLALTRLLAEPGTLAGRIIVDVTIDATGVGSIARVGRTRSDRASVAAVARRTAGGERYLALAGVAAHPVLVAAVDELDPAGDYRGSKEYRRALAATLSARALEAVG